MASLQNVHAEPPASRPPPSSTTDALTYRLEGVWPAPPDAVREEVVKFWLAESAISELAAAHQRAHQLLVVERDPDGKIAGVSTALRMHVEHLGFECFFYRTFVGRAHRASGIRSTGLVWKILHTSFGGNSHDTARLFRHSSSIATSTTFPSVVGRGAGEPAVAGGGDG